MTNKVFISYETTTGLSLAKHVSASLSKLNFPSFIAERDIKKGGNWRETIDNALEDCEIFILIATNLALKSEEVIKEISFAVLNYKEIIPCKKSNVNEVALYTAFPIINKIQRIDFKDEFELSDSIIEVLINREVNNQYEDKLSINYSHLEKISSGGFGEIYKAIRRTDDRIVAVNVINRTDHNGKKIITNSASIWLKLKHKNIVELTGVNFSPLLYIEQEFCETSLADKSFPLELHLTLKIMIELCEGIAYAHSLGIIHGDLKPSNILFKNGEVKIADWGFSIDTNTNKDVTRILTPNYASPEQIKFDTIDTRSDLYQLGIVFYEMLTNCNPNQSSRRKYDFASIAASDYLEQYINKDKETKVIERPSVFNMEAVYVDNIIIKLLKEKKEERYQTITELITDLKAIK